MNELDEQIVNILYVSFLFSVSASYSTVYA